MDPEVRCCLTSPFVLTSSLDCSFFRYPPTLPSFHFIFFFTGWYLYSKFIAVILKGHPPCRIEAAWAVHLLLPFSCQRKIQPFSTLDRVM